MIKKKNEWKNEIKKKEKLKFIREWKEKKNTSKKPEIYLEKERRIEANSKRKS